MRECIKSPIQSDYIPPAPDIPQDIKSAPKDNSQGNKSEGQDIPKGIKSEDGEIIQFTDAMLNGKHLFTKKYSDEQWTHGKELLAQGYTLKDAGKKSGILPSSLATKANHQNWQRRRKHPRVESKKLARKTIQNALPAAVRTVVSQLQKQPELVQTLLREHIEHSRKFSTEAVRRLDSEALETTDDLRHGMWVVSSASEVQRKALGLDKAGVEINTGGGALVIGRLREKWLDAPAVEASDATGSSTEGSTGGGGVDAVDVEVVEDKAVAGAPAD